MRDKRDEGNAMESLRAAGGAKRRTPVGHQKHHVEPTCKMMFMVGYFPRRLFFISVDSDSDPTEGR